jgi:hypothetical protein
MLVNCLPRQSKLLHQSTSIGNTPAIRRLTDGESVLQPFHAWTLPRHGIVIHQFWRKDRVKLAKILVLKFLAVEQTIEVQHNLSVVFLGSGSQAVLLLVDVVDYEPL